MDVFFATQCGKMFYVEVGYWDTVLEIKKKIDKYQRIPVSKQTLFFEDNVLQDHLDIEQCQILHKSRVFVFVSPYPYDNNDQVIQTKQSPIPKQIINGHQDSTQELQTELSPPSNSVKENIKFQDSPGKKIVIIFLLPYSSEARAVKYVYCIANPTDQVQVLRNFEVLRNALLLQSRGRGHLNHFFIHKRRVLNEDQSFEWNGVGHTDQVEIVPDPWLY